MNFDSPSMIVTHFAEDYTRHYGAIVPPVYMNSLNVFPTIEDYYSQDTLNNPDAYVYGRVGNPTVAITERKIAALEHGKWAALFASGMAATTSAIIACCKKESEVVCVRNAYGPVKSFFHSIGYRYGIKVRYVKGIEVSEFEDAINDNTDLVMLESPSTAVFTLQDITEVSKIAHRHSAKVIIDNTYCTPIFQNPLDMGVDLVMHTASKYLGGHSDLIGGVLVGNDDALKREIYTVERELIGGIIGPAEAWLIMRGMRTLGVRLPQHQKNATAVASFLEKHPKVKAVHYPGLDSYPQKDLMRKQQRGNSGLLSFEIDGPETQARRVVNSLSVFKIGVSWGGFESLVCMPYLHETEKNLELLGGGRGLIRIHCGLENVENLVEDLDQALSIL
jgi:cystathionine beta-lyase/cystathionine gamma-synthase